MTDGAGTLDFEELDYGATPLGELILRRRRDPRLPARDVYEVKLGDEFLMSSAFTEGEVALADRGLAELKGRELDVVVGGLGLGYTANAVLRHASVRSVIVIEALARVIDWHRRALVPLGEALTRDPRCRLVQGDFFTRVGSESGFDEQSPGRRFDAVLVDIDHSPRRWLNAGHRSFYEPAGLRHVAGHLHPGGVFALWSNDLPDGTFEQALDAVFAARDSHVVTFDNPYTGGKSACTVYVVRSGA
ncbi:MAG: Polyamine aminopropyltransferase [Gammaproteobacteria bacterium]|nr:Polyamine aminopropyltransferase [Gammaproteobacteria bacterium]